MNINNIKDDLNLLTHYPSLYNWKGKSFGKAQISSLAGVGSGKESNARIPAKRLLLS